MKVVKCIGCGELKRDVQPLDKVNPKFPLVIYGCDRFPYWCALSGLLKPSKGIEKAAADCPVDITKACCICGTEKGLKSYGDDKFVFTCIRHYGAWSAWLDAHPEKMAYFSPRRRIIGARWIEVFREWVAYEKKDIEDGTK